MFSDDSDSEPAALPSVLQRPTVANHIVQERITMDTADHEDHTFCGVMFDVRCIRSLPIEFVEITSVAVRGGLGPMTVWTAPDTYQGKFEKMELRRHWTKIYEKDHEASFLELVPLELSHPVQLRAGQSCGLFVHSQRPGDRGVVYDNLRGSRGNAPGNLLSILPGVAAIDNRPFGQQGMWGQGWRHNREFVGRLGVGVCWRLWNPEVHQLFPGCFRSAVRCLLLCAVRPDCALHGLSDAVIFYILNMCRWDWFGDGSGERQEQEEQQGADPHRRPVTWRPLYFSDSDEGFSSEEEDIRSLF